MIEALEARVRVLEGAETAPPRDDAGELVDRVLCRAAGRAHGTQVQKRGAAAALERARTKARAAAIKAIDRPDAKRKSRRKK
jgi:hypothetical protein